MTEREQSHDERRTEESVPTPPATDDTADVADVIEQSTVLGSEEGDEETAAETGFLERGEASEADAVDQLRSVTDPEEDYR